MYFIKTPNIVKTLFKGAIWTISNGDNKVFLTFDDGPTKEITQKTLAVLKEKNVKATFFCLGKQVEENPAIYKQILDEKHAVGNHSFSHLKGWNTENKKYLEDVRKGEKIIHSNLFRPPYGKIKRSQLKELNSETKVILWDVLPGDFSPKNTVTTIVSNTINNVEAGSIIVLHDNDKCGEKMLEALPLIIDKLKQKGFQFEAITL